MELKPVSEAEVKAIQTKAATPVETKTPVVATATPQATITPAPAEIKKEEKGSTTKVGEDGKVITPQKKSIKEFATPFSPKSKKEITPADEIPDNYKTKFAEYEKQIAERDARLKVLQEDADLEIVREAKKAGKSVYDILKATQGEDISKLSDMALIEKKLRASGVKPSNELEDGSEESSLEEELDKFKALPKTARDREIASIRNEYEAVNTNKASEFLSTLKTSNADRDKVSLAEQQKEYAALQKTQKDLDSMADAYVGQLHYGVLGDPKKAESIKNFKINDLVRTNEDGSLNAEDLFDLFHYKLFKDERLEKLEEQFYSQGFDDLKKEVEVTGAQKSNLVRTPQTPTMTDVQAREHIHSTLRPVN